MQITAVEKLAGFPMTFAELSLDLLQQSLHFPFGQSQDAGADLSGSLGGSRIERAHQDATGVCAQNEGGALDRNGCHYAMFGTRFTEISNFK
jgi:hypothetical protein